MRNARGAVRKLLARVLYVTYGVAIAVVLMLALWVATGFARRPAFALALQRAASRIALACLGCRLVVHGAPPSSAHGPNVFVANHSSYLDILLVLAALKCDFVFVVKSEILRWPIIAQLTRAGAHIPVDRDRAESRSAVVGRVVQALRAGRSALVFPEGTFSHADRLRSFRSGAFRAALAADVAIVPIALGGVAEVWSHDAWFPRPGRVDIWFGDALQRADAEGGEAVDDLRVRALHFIESQLDRARTTS
jgi:1-acyl-sn-glycerol-3-phosphate acyltransferase